MARYLPGQRTLGGPRYNSGNALPLPGARLWPGGVGPELLPLQDQGPSFAFGQAQASILITGYGFGQAQADIKHTYSSHAQAQAAISGSVVQFGQAQGDIKQIYFALAQAQADIKQTYFALAQAQASIKGNAFGQAQADIKQTYFALAQAQALIKGSPLQHAQAQADVKQTYFAHAQAQALIPGNIAIYAHGQARALIQTSRLLDTFSRIEDIDVLGTPDIGPAYEQILSDFVVTLGHFSIDGNVLNVVFEDEAGQIYIENPVNVLNYQYSIEFSYDHLDPIYEFFYMEFAGGVTEFFDDAVAPYLVSDNSGPIGTNVFFGIDVYYKVAPFSESADGAYITVEAGTTYIVKYEVSNDLVQAKIWNKSDPEPDWLISLVLTGTTSYGYVHYYSRPLSSGVPNILQVDNWNVLSIDPIMPHGQAQAAIKATNSQFAQARAVIIRTLGSGQAQAKIRGTYRKHAQARAVIRKSAGYGQAKADIKKTLRGHAQARAQINQSKQTGQAQADIRKTTNKSAQAKAKITYRIFANAQAQAAIEQTERQVAQAQALIYTPAKQVAQANALIDSPVKNQYAQSQASIKQIYRVMAQAQAYIWNREWRFAQANALISSSGVVQTVQTGQAQAKITNNFGFKYAQAQAYIRLRAGYGQARGYIIIKGTPNCAQAMAYIIRPFAFGQTQAMIKKTMFSGQAQGYIKKLGISSGQAQASVANGLKYGQAQAYISGGRYLVKYNQYVLPGYAQKEDIESAMNTQGHYTGFEDMSLSEYTGLKNKLISLTMRVWEEDYYESKEQIKLAATMLRSKSSGFSALYIQRSDRHYEALAKKISFESDARQSGRIVDYAVEFECKPWLISDVIYTVSGTGTISTDQVARNIYNGGWSPVTLNVTGNNITVSGYTNTEQFTGFVTISGTVSGYNLDTENEGLTTLYVGPGKTTFVVTGATDCEISYHDRWYL